MTKDSICKDCEHLLTVSGSLIATGKPRGTRDFIHRRCKVSVYQLTLVSEEVQIRHCSEFSSRDKPPYKIPPPDPSRFQIIEDTRWQLFKGKKWFQMIKELFHGKT